MKWDWREHVMMPEYDAPCGRIVAHMGSRQSREGHRHSGKLGCMLNECEHYDSHCLDIAAQRKWDMGWTKG